MLEISDKILGEGLVVVVSVVCVPPVYELPEHKVADVLLRADDQRRKFEVDGEAGKGDEDPYNKYQ